MRKLSKEEIKSGNKSIATFMALRSNWRAKKVLQYGFGPRSAEMYGKYHELYDWLIPVCKTLNSYINEELSIAEYHELRDAELTPIPNPIEYPIQYVWESVVKTIDEISNFEY